MCASLGARFRRLHQLSGSPLAAAPPRNRRGRRHRRPSCSLTASTTVSGSPAMIPGEKESGVVDAAVHVPPAAGYGPAEEVGGKRAEPDAAGQTRPAVAGKPALSLRVAGIPPYLFGDPSDPQRPPRPAPAISASKNFGTEMGGGASAVRLPSPSPAPPLPPSAFHEHNAFLCDAGYGFWLPHAGPVVEDPETASATSESFPFQRSAIVPTRRSPRTLSLSSSDQGPSSGPFALSSEMIVPPPALRMPQRANSTSTSTSGSTWNAAYNRSPKTNTSSWEDLPQRVPPTVEPFVGSPRHDKPNTSRSHHHLGEGAPFAPGSPTYSPRRPTMHRRRDSSLSISSEHTVSALPSPSTSVSFPGFSSIWGFLAGDDTMGGGATGLEFLSGIQPTTDPYFSTISRVATELHDAEHGRRMSNVSNVAVDDGNLECHALSTANGESNSLLVTPTSVEPSESGLVAAGTAAVPVATQAAEITKWNPEFVASEAAASPVPPMMSTADTLPDSAAASLKNAAGAPPMSPPATSVSNTSVALPVNETLEASACSPNQSRMISPVFVPPAGLVLSSSQTSGARSPGSPLSIASPPGGFVPLQRHPTLVMRNRLKVAPEEKHADAVSVSLPGSPIERPLVLRPPAPIPAHELPARAKSPPRRPSQDAKVEGRLLSASDSVPPAAAQPTGAGQAEVDPMSAAVNDRSPVVRATPNLHHERPHPLVTPGPSGSMTFPTRVGRYSIVKNLGKGSFSVVYLGSIVDAKERAPQTHPSPWDLLVAIKVIPRAAILEDNRLKASVDREIQLLEYSSGHPGVVRFVEMLSVRPDGSLRRLTRKPAPNAVSVSTSSQGNSEIGTEGHRGGRLKPEQRDDCVATSPIPASTLWGPDIDDSSGWDCLVLEYVAGGELFDWVMDRFSSGDTKRAEVINNGLESVAHADVESAEESRRTHEDDVRAMFRQLVEVVSYLHSRNIAHRDLKLENILITEVPYRTYPDLKVTDFGLARLFDPASPLLTTRCGSEEYAAPEIILGQPYDGRLTDAWALGVILYSMLTGDLPFALNEGERRRKYLSRIARAEFKWPAGGRVRFWKRQKPRPGEDARSPKVPQWYTISPEARHVVDGLIMSSASRRWTLDRVRESSWFTWKASSESSSSR